MRAAKLLLPLALLAVTGCSIKQTVTPATLSAELVPEICTIPAPGLRAGFSTTYQQLLRDKGFRTRQLAPGSNPGRCPLSTTFTGTWRWDLLLYMNYADIRVFSRTAARWARPNMTPAGAADARTNSSAPKARSPS